MAALPLHQCDVWAAGCWHEGEGERELQVMQDGFGEEYGNGLLVIGAFAMTAHFRNYCILPVLLI